MSCTNVDDTPIEGTTLPIPDAPSDAAAPEVPQTWLCDVYGEKYKLGESQSNGCHTVLRPGKSKPWTLMPIPAYPDTDCRDLSDLYTITSENSDGDEVEAEEILLPASEINASDDASLFGVVLPRNLKWFVRGDQWHPEWLSSDRFWRMLARLADGLDAAAALSVHPVRLTRDRLFIDETNDKICLVVARANRITDDMRLDPWLAAALPPEFRADPSQEQVAEPQTGYMLTALILSLLLDWTPDSMDKALIDVDETGHISALEALPPLLPLHDELVALMTRGFDSVPENRPALSEWQGMLNRCADEMRRRLGDTSSVEENDGVPSSLPEDAETAIAEGNGNPSEVISQFGSAWVLAGAGQPICEAHCKCAAYRLPDDQWQLWDPKLDNMTAARRRQFSVLRFPVDALLWNGARYVCFEDQTSKPDGHFQWTNYQNLAQVQKDPGGALRLAAALIEDIERAHGMGLDICMLSTRQLVNLPEAAVLLCGQNIKDGHAMSPASVARHLLSKLADSTQMSPELRHMLANPRLYASADVWTRSLGYAADHIRPCPKCATPLMPGALCPDCRYAALMFEVHRNVEPAREEIVLAADTTEIALNQLYPGALETPVISFAWEATRGCFSATNLSMRDWKIIVGGKADMLRPRQALDLSPGTRLSILPRQLELKYAWPV